MWNKTKPFRHNHKTLVRCAASCIHERPPVRRTLRSTQARVRTWPSLFPDPLASLLKTKFRHLLATLPMLQCSVIEARSNSRRSRCRFHYLGLMEVSVRFVTPFITMKYTVNLSIENVGAFPFMRMLQCGPRLPKPCCHPRSLLKWIP